MCFLYIIFKDKINLMLLSLLSNYESMCVCMEWSFYIIGDNLLILILEYCGKGGNKVNELVCEGKINLLRRN